MQNLGHFEFGLDRRPINFGSTKQISEIQKLLNEENILGLAKYWVIIYSYVLKLLDDISVNQNLLLIDYDDFCKNPLDTLTKLYQFCGLEIKNGDQFGKRSDSIFRSVDLRCGYSAIKSGMGLSAVRCGYF